MRDTRLVPDGLARRARGHAFGLFLLVEAFALHAIRTPLHREQVVLHVRPEFREYQLIKLRQITFGIAFLRPKNLIRMGDRSDRAPVAELARTAPDAGSHVHTVPFAG